MVTNHYYESAVFSIKSSANRLKLNRHGVVVWWGFEKRLIPVFGIETTWIENGTFGSFQSMRLF